MKAIRYIVECYDGVLAWNHGCSRDVEELYIPALKVRVNLEGNVNIFPEDGPRNTEKNEEITLSDPLKATIITYLTLQKTIEKSVKKALEGLKPEEE